MLQGLPQAMQPRLSKRSFPVRSGGHGPEKEEAAVLIITVQVNAPPGSAIGIKEDLATYLERFGDARVVSITEKEPEQLRLPGTGAKT